MPRSRSRLAQFIPALALMLLGGAVQGCGGGASGTSPAPPPPVVVPPVVIDAPPDFSDVGAAFDRHDVTDMVLIIGDAGGPLYTRNKGSVQPDTVVRLASASKLITGLAIWTLVEDGTLDVDQAVAGTVRGWPASGPISRVTLDQLMAFTSGFNARPDARTCAGRQAVSLRDCVTDIVRPGPDTEPGAAYAYGPEHMQIAGLMVREQTGVELYDVVQDNVLQPAGAADGSGFPAYENVRYSAGARMSAADYGRVLQALLAGGLVSDREAYLADRTSDVTFAYRPDTLGRAALDWHYG